MAKRARPSNHRSPRTLSETISTLVFVGMSGWLLLEALSLMGQAPSWQVGGLFLSAFLSLLGAFRFMIAQLWRQFRKGRGQ
ncbi:hypothetical protein [Roseicyclus sp.]|uniref:hypothetical protein n=1 Tax=Roseicyclus sp. TaxID=1914329 RepID=UPI003F6C2D3F